MRETPLVVAASLALVAVLAALAYVVGGILSDPHPPEPVPWNADPVKAQETWETIQRGMHAVPPAR